MNSSVGILPIFFLIRSPSISSSVVSGDGKSSHWCWDDSGSNAPITRLVAVHIMIVCVRVHWFDGHSLDHRYDVTADDPIDFIPNLIIMHRIRIFYYIHAFTKAVFNYVHVVHEHEQTLQPIDGQQKTVLAYLLCGACVCYAMHFVSK